jgi:hypothetical protein
VFHYRAHFISRGYTSIKKQFLIPGNEEKRRNINYLASFSYNLSPYLTMGVKFEHETRQPMKQSGKLKYALTQELKNYSSVALSVNPVQNHTIKIEYGSFSEGKKCAFGSCTTIPSFKGIRGSITSTF